jgi:phosphoribosylformylglycinamidine synthase
VHDVGAGGISNALPELAHGAGSGAHFELRAVNIEEAGMSPAEIWCNEAQERYVLAIAPGRLAEFAAICERERCPFAVVGVTTPTAGWWSADRHFGNQPVDMDMDALLGKPPRMTRTATICRRLAVPFDATSVDLKEAAYRVLRLPAVADKTFLISIGDRTVGGLTARDQMVGPWQVPCADVAVTLMAFHGYRRSLRGRRTRAAGRPRRAGFRPHGGRRSADQPRRGRHRDPRRGQAVGQLDGRRRFPRRGCAPVRHRARGLRPLPDDRRRDPGRQGFAVDAHPWQDGAGEQKEVVSPLSLIVTGFARVQDARRTLTPQLVLDAGETDLLLIDLGGGRNRLGGSALAQVYAATGNDAPDVDDPARLAAFFGAIRQLAADDLLLAYHDRRRRAVRHRLRNGFCRPLRRVDRHRRPLLRPADANDVDGNEKRPDLLGGRSFEMLMRALFNEELGAVCRFAAPTAAG